MLRTLRKQVYLRLKFLIAFAIVTALTCFIAWQVGKPDSKVAGKINNRGAWEASYLERDLPVPESGPREGYWGKRLGGTQRDEHTHWRESKIYVSGLLDIDNRGYQHYSNSEQLAYKIVIVGGSIAFGAYASEIEKTYFNVIGSQLKRHQIDASITIIASSTWKSVQEVIAVQQFMQRHQPDLVIFLDGLNDITNGATVNALYGQPTETLDGSEWSLHYHAHDYVQRVNLYMKHIKYAFSFIEQSGAEMLVVLQPALFERRKRTDIEDSLLEASLPPLGNVKYLQKSYDAIRFSIAGMSRQKHMHFLDTSRIFDHEEATTFTDIWHFSDPGHQILGETIANKIATILSRR